VLVKTSTPPTPTSMVRACAGCRNNRVGAVAETDKERKKRRRLEATCGKGSARRVCEISSASAK
jgi:hypothetical protein